MVPIHLDARAISQKEFRFGAGRHLRAMRSAIATKRRRSCRTAGWRRGGSLRRDVFVVLAISVGAERDQERERDDAAKQAWFGRAPGGLAQAIGLFRSGRAHDVLRLLLPALAGLDLEDQAFADPGALTILGKGRDMGENLRSTLGRCDEPKAAIIIPFGQRAIDAHKFEPGSFGHDTELTVAAIPKSVPTQ